ncbi:chromosome segregation protein [Paucilactobacillus oligofermentans DSM 15707 = LMG 22743]|uniref:Chromosome partition protein Smc n=1 Tax=Paucilactobacillus oligofermentans DSM 15707 = LMG 22743 TaxID=1423778 RepID=A0A0R1RE82_9LACO|nr:chromosome segregation protein SMC [Paucilactobacillus oligofermentans]KRL54897.1 chromosome segregation protein [Paucilactobacillus oligofermentans DSM 15707 = LMG 22743]CUS26188.1 Chromosome partition protein Smc [Paucilactobacillus oligofermentans DSM 15707 = LMG 22743]
MRLISLEINGFKSFAQKTKINFMPGMTGIVGPNGSGKSNIIEAVRWVMGEQSAKDLRGDRMADVIFSGSSTRKALNRAEVSITFDNSDHYIQSDFNEIRVTRQLYRSGESQYLINNQECRLKDVTELFMDSGLGRESFSIISQGRVEEIFNGKPSDRRKVIEEVAGVSKYKKNKDTAEKRLNDTNDNLNRVNDILAELETQVEPLAEQSALAKEYQEQKIRFDQLDKTKTVLDITDHQKKHDEIQERVLNAQKMSEQYDVQNAHSTQQLAELKQQQVRLTAIKDELQAKLLNQTQSISELENSQNISNERSNNRQANLEQINRQIEQLKIQIDDATKELADLNQEQTQHLTKVQHNKDDLKQLRSLSAEERQAQMANQIESLQNEQVEQMQALTTLHNQKSFLIKNHEQDNKRQSQASIDLTAAQQKQTELQQTIQEVETELQENKVTLAKHEATLNEEASRRKSLRTSYDDTQKQWYQALGSEQTLQAKINSIKSLEADYSGFYQGVRFTLQHRTEFNGLLGPVSELIDVPTKYMTAIETVLGAQLQNLVVDNQTTGKQIINYLVAKKAGRVTILPVDTLSVHSLNTNTVDAIAAIAGFEGLASDLVTVDNTVIPVLKHLLGNTVVADNLDHATQISRTGQHRVRVVTLDGQLINASGSMTGGANKQQRQGLLSRQQELETFETKLSVAKAASTKFEEEVAKYDAAIKANQQSGEQFQQQVVDQRAVVQEINGRLLITENETDVIKKQVTALEFEVNQNNAESSSYSETLANNETEQGTVTAKIEAIKMEVVQLKSDLDNLKNNASVQARQIQEREQLIAVESEKITHGQQEIKRVEVSLANFELRLSNLQKQTNNDNATQAEQEELQRNNQLQLVELKANKQATETEIDKTNQQLNKTSDEVDAADQQQVRAQELQRAALDELNKVNARSVKLETLIDTGMNRLSERYAMSFNEANLDLIELPIEDIVSQLKLLKRGLDEIGPVNLGSIDEYERVSKRFNFLNDQKDDLMDSKQQLNETMAEMDEEVKSRFESSFNEVAGEFEKIFIEMFGGGQAKLVLTEPDNMLTTGVDIIAQPPGKKNQQMSLLSGGERALTAITLLFSILAVRPVPFAILDETEAALDDANVNRFARYLSTYGDDGPQFIVVTHRKGTMMNAKVLYGVTMQESGVSKMVSVSLEDVRTT